MLNDTLHIIFIIIINIGQLIQSVLIQSVYIIFYFILFRILVIIYAFNNLFLHCILYRHTYIIYIYIQYISCIQ